MIFTLKIDPACEETVVATVRQKTPLIEEVERLLLSDSADTLPCYREDEIVLVDIGQIECFLAESDKTYAVCTDKKRYLVKKRLYELEEILPKQFERISKSAIGNWRHIVKFKVQLSGAVDAVFRSGYSECVSRRCFAELKRRYGL